MGALLLSGIINACYIVSEPAALLRYRKRGVRADDVNRSHSGALEDLFVPFDERAAA